MPDPRQLPVPAEWEGAIQGYLTHCRAFGLRPQSLRTFRERLSHLARRVSSGPFELTNDELLAYLSEQRWAPATLRARTQTFRGFWRWAAKKGFSAFDPSEDTPRGKPIEANPQAVPYVTYLETLVRSDARTRRILRLAGEAGLRRGEIAVGHTRDILTSNTGPSLEVHGKGGKVRVVPLTADLEHELRVLPEGFFFPGKIDGHLSARRVSELAKARLPEPWTIHKLRHMFATRSFAVSKDLVSVQRILGHASITTTTAYVQTSDEGLRNIVNAVAVRAFDYGADQKIRKAASRVVTFDLETVTSEQATQLIALLSQKVTTSRGFEGDLRSPAQRR